MNCKNCAVIACDGYGEDHEPERCEFYELMSNADRIRSLSDEDLAKQMVEKVKCEYCPEVHICGYFPSWTRSCEQVWLDWLRKDAAEL